MKKIYIVYNQWQMDSETWMVIFHKAFFIEEKAEAYRKRLEEESTDKNNDNFLIEEVECE